MRRPTICRVTWPGKPGVGDVRYDRQWLARLVGIVTTARLIAADWSPAILMLGAAFTVAAVVRLSLYARRDELEIMQLVGAPFSYIRGPAIVEGLLLGGIGAAVALVGDCIPVFDAVAVAGLRPRRAWPASASCGSSGLQNSSMMLLGGVGVGAAAGHGGVDEPSD